jgi:hypothetical protein
MNRCTVRHDIKDFSPASKNAFSYALHLAEEFAAELTLLYVLATCAVAQLCRGPRSTGVF